MAARRLPKRASTLSKRALRFEGVDELIAKLDEIASAMSGQEIKEGLMKRVGIPIRDRARAMAPIKTGELKRAIYAAYGDNNKTTILVGVNYKIAPHAHLVEFGHAGPHPAPPHPYMRPALAESIELAKKGIEETYREVLKKHT